MINLHIKAYHSFFLTGFALLLLILFSCATLQEIAKVQQPRVNVQNVRFTGMSFDAIDLAFDVAIHNPNPFGAKLSGFDYDFFLNENSFLKGQQNSQLNIEALGQSTVEIPLTLNFKDIYNTYQSLKNQDSTTYKIACGLAFDLPVLGPIRIPVSRSGKVPMLKLPDVKIGSLKLNKITFSSADLELKLKVDNPNSFNFLLNRLNYDFAINGKTWAKGITQNQMQIQEKGESAISIPVSLNFMQMGRTVYGIITGDQKLNYELKGDLDLNTSIPMLGQVNLPIDRVGEINILK